MATSLARSVPLTGTAAPISGVPDTDARPMRTLLIYIGNWCALLVIAILNGALREKAYGPHMTELAAHQVSTAIGICLFAVYIWILTGVCTIGSERLAVSIGGVWLGMTIAFEFLFGHFVMGRSWGHLFHDYNLFAGRLWVLVLVWTAIAPYVFCRIRSS
jgi:hypothetical protein